MGVHEGKKVIFDDVDAALRTEESFKGRTDKEHHKSLKSPLEDVVGFNIVDHIIIAERMHQSDLGISKKNSYRIC